MEVGSVLVTGANRGIGFEFVRQLVNLNKPPKYVFATYRNKDTVGNLEEIQKTSKVSKVILIQMEATSDEDIEAAKKVVEDVTSGEGLNLLINNAGVVEKATFHEITEENIMFHFTNNTLGPIKVFKAFLPLLQQAAASKTDEGMSVSKAAVINISSMAGSLEHMNDGSMGDGQAIRRQDFRKKWVDPITGYSISKAALNMAMRTAAFQVRDQGILVANYCPGPVVTDMTERNHMTELGGFSTPEESISAMLNSFSKLTDSSTGLFFDKHGEVMPF